MLKSEWKELPDWTKPEEYGFLDGANKEVWAWEFLRRNPAYRRYWRRLQQCRAKYGIDWNPEIFSPPKAPEETTKAWKARVLLSYRQPQHLPLDQRLGRKWVLTKLCDPTQPFTQGVSFEAQRMPRPRLLLFPEQFLDLVEDDETDDGVAFQRVSNRYAVIMFDSANPVTNQMKSAAALLKAWQAKLKSAGNIQLDADSEKSYVWMRHLRVLDARRATPTPPWRVIGKLLAANMPPAATKDDMRKAGEKLGKAAIAQMRRHNKVLAFSGTPGTINKK